MRTAFLAFLGGLMLGNAQVLLALPLLEVALTNDDGWQATGIQQLHRVLKEAGHRVTLVAPADEQSGSSAAVNTEHLIIVRKAEDQFATAVCADSDCNETKGAEPASTAVIAIDLAQRRAGGKAPDLLLSGINSGPNVGSSTQISGTVGATVTSLSASMNGAVPAMAISAAEPEICAGDSDCLKGHYRQVAIFVAELIEHLVARKGDTGSSLLPPGVGLNINYPGRVPKGLRVVRQEDRLLLGDRAVQVNVGCDACLELAIGESAQSKIISIIPANLPDQNGEIDNFRAGYVTVVPIRIDYTANDFLDFTQWFEGLAVPGEALPEQGRLSH